MSNRILATCADNQYILDKLKIIRNQYIRSGEDNKAMNTKKIMAAVSKFPLPVLSGKLAEYLIQGVGPWFANKIDTWVKEAPVKRKGEITEPVKRIKVSNYTPEPGTGEWVLLLCIHQHSSARNLTELRAVFIDKFIERYKCDWPIDPEKCIQTLVDKQLLQVDENYSYLITLTGRSVANQLEKTCPEKFLKSASVDLSILKSFNPDSWFDTPSQSARSDIEILSLSQRIVSTKVILKIDTAERLSQDFEIISERLLNRNIEVEKAKLWVGDYQWVLRVKLYNEEVQDFSLGMVVERKRADDLAASIIDGRYENQRYRLKRSGARCIYLLEGTKPSSSTKITEETLLQALISTHFSYSFTVKITKDPNDTLNWLARMTILLQVETGNWSESKVFSLQSFNDYMHSTNPNKNLTIGDVFGKQLRAIDKCGEQSTLAILKAFPTPKFLYNAIQETYSQKNAARAADKLLKEVKLENGQKLRKDLRSKLLNLFG